MIEWFKRLFQIRITLVVVRPKDLPEDELNAALRDVPEEHKVYRAFMQLINTFEDEAHDKADADIYIPRALECHTGGAKYLRALRNNVLARRRKR